ncbi:hypothetical protein NE237_024042 [Protea cynaroides]|uniref:Uncharacterized protein n=1 Tax=Protea cynaroides TaxID=273540 RepID=A0A9Q0HG17_9MAGN|nr:hypothetical protein NE237_024042 [Protea cynaroides]
MADSTHLRQLDEPVKGLGETATKHGERLDSLQASITELVIRIIAIDGKLVQVIRMSPSPSDPLHSTIGSPPPAASASNAPMSTNSVTLSNALAPSIQMRMIRLDFPRFTALIQGLPIQILVDSGSTHNFIQSFAHYFGLPVEAAPRMMVLFGNGTTLHNEGLVRQLPVKFTNHCTTMMFWKRTIEFGEGDNRVCLSGNTNVNPSQLCFQGMRRLIGTDSVAALYCLELQQLQELHNEPPTTCPSSLTDLLRSYDSFFAEPIGLPPI